MEFPIFSLLFMLLFCRKHFSICFCCLFSFTFYFFFYFILSINTSSAVCVYAYLPFLLKVYIYLDALQYTFLDTLTLVDDFKAPMYIVYVLLTGCLRFLIGGPSLTCFFYFIYPRKLCPSPPRNTTKKEKKKIMIKIPKGRNTSDT